MHGSGRRHQARESLPLAGACGGAVVALVVAGACEPNFDALDANYKPGANGHGGATTTSSSVTHGSASSSTSTTSSSGAGGSTSSSTGSSSSSGYAPTYDFTFDTDVQGWTGRTYETALMNLAPTVAFNATLGHAAPGSAEGSITFTATGQAAFIRYVPMVNAMGVKPDLTGRTLTGWVYVESTMVSIQLSAFAQSITNVTFLAGATTVVNPGDAPRWIMLAFAVPPKSASWDPTVINQFGIEVVSTGTAGDAGATDAGTTASTVVAVDDYSVQ
jgi:hypothetical protein